MADYYPLIARAISGLDPSAPGESRRALYERARAALIAQLRSVQPPLSESEITRERLSLEEAVRKVESEAAQRARDATRSGDAARSGDATRAADAPPLPRQPQSQPHVPMQDPQLPPTRERSGAPRRGADNGAPQAPGMRGFRDIAADADDLGRAAAQANRSARKTYANVPSPSPEFDRLEPNMENRGADPDAPYPFDETAAEAPKDAGTPLSKPKIPDRGGQPSSTDQVAPVAQRVVLYDEDPADPKGKQYVGSVIWRTEQIKAAGGQNADIAVRADIEIPDRKFKMTMSFRRNTDTSLPASHTAELTFILPPDFTGGGVGNVPGILMKSNEQARGTPLAGLAVKVTDGFFLVGLSNVDADRQRNLQLLKERSWFDVPLVYVNQRRAIIAIEKGAPGERAFNDAFAAWGE